MGVFNKLVKFPDRFIADQNIIANIIELKRNKMLLTEENYTCELSKETQEIAKKELNETNKLRKKAIADVRKWIKSRSNFRRARLDASFILRFLRMQKFDTKESCEILDKYLTMRVQHPTWFQNLDCRDQAISDLVDQGPVEHEHTPVVRKKS